MNGNVLLIAVCYRSPDAIFSGKDKSSSSQNFVDHIVDGFMTQDVSEFTGYDAILDSVITSEPGMIDTVSVLGRFGNSDHNLLEWNVHFCN